MQKGRTILFDTERPIDVSLNTVILMEGSSMKKCFILFVFVGSLVLFASCTKVDTTKTSTVSSVKTVIVTYIEGTVRLTGPGNEMLTAAEGLSLEPGTVIETGPDGRCIVSLDDMGTFDVSEETTVAVDCFYAEKRQGALSLFSGSVRSKIEKLGGNDTYIIRGGSLVCGVRGTDFTVSLSPENDFSVKVDEGTVTVFPAILLDEGLHPSFEFLPPGKSVPRSVPISGEQRALLLSALPVLAKDEQQTYSVELVETLVKALEPLIEEVMNERDVAPLLQEITVIIQKALKSIESDERTENAVEPEESPVTVIEDTFRYTVRGMDPPSVFEIPGEWWPRPLPARMVPVDKTAAIGMSTTNTATMVNSRSSGEATVSIKNKRAKITITKPYEFDWGVIVEPSKERLLSPGSLYLARFTAWTDGSPMIVTSCLNEGGIDYNGDGDGYSLYQNISYPVREKPVRYTVAYYHVHKKNSGAGYNVSTGPYPGTVYVQDIELETVAGHTYTHISDDELVRNGSFSYGFLFWEPAKFTEPDLDGFSVDNGRLVYETKQRASEQWKVKLFSKVPLEKGEQYILSFDVYAEASGFIGIDIVEDGHDKNNDGNKSSPNAPYMTVKTIPGSWQHYEIMFTALESDPESRFSLNLGDVQGKIQLDNVSLKMR